MKIVGNAIIEKKIVNERQMYYLKVREYNRDGEFEEADLYCRLTKKVHDYLSEILDNASDVQINIKESFFTVDKYYKGEQEFTKPTIVLADVEIE